jgi:peptidyl-prolyl cis-trans isomerase C
MNRMPATFGAVALALLAVACTQKTGTAADGKSDTVAVVDGVVITRKLFDEYVKTVTNTPQADLTPQQRDGLLENLIRGNVLAREAARLGVTKDDKVTAVLELHRLDVLSRATGDKYLEGKTPTEAELRAEYDKRLAAMEKLQYRASHILVKDEAEAKQIIALLKAGGNFGQIAKAKSTDTVSADKGGDLEWFSPSAMTPVFAEAVTSLKKGETSQNPVKTEYGFHVIRVTDIRDSVPPSFESVKDQLLKIVDAKKFNAYTEELVKKAKITKSL